MSEEKQNQGSLTSFIPILLLGVATFFMFQFMGGDEESAPEGNAPLVPAEKRNDFRFSSGSGDETIIETDRAVFVVTTEGGRIARLYLKKSNELHVPESLIEESD
ncbi:MAG TPA: hypothetical protein DEA96_05980, partial [Leptospiraceae bacterium]|nr:hypothetical protein [Leptospiraceae bacterium]